MERLEDKASVAFVTLVSPEAKQMQGKKIFLPWKGSSISGINMMVRKRGSAQEMLE